MFWFSSRLAAEKPRRNTFPTYDQAEKARAEYKKRGYRVTGIRCPG